MPTFVIAAASLAGAKAAETLREEGFDGEIVLLGAELERPYERLPLSKGYLLGNDERDSIYVHSAEWYDEHGVVFRPGVTVTAIDRSASAVVTSGAAGTEELGYDRLLLTTGASPRRLEFPGSDRDEVLYLRTVQHSERLRGREDVDSASALLPWFSRGVGVGSGLGPAFRPGDAGRGGRGRLA